MNNEKKIVLFTFTAHFLFHFFELAFPALVIPLVLSLNMNLEEVLKLGFPMYLGFGLFSLPWGFLPTVSATGLLLSSASSAPAPGQS